jgi:hypothetical protein
MDLTDIRDWILPDVAGCPKALVLSRLREVLDDFCKESWILRAAADAIDLAADTAEYDISFTGDYLPIAIYEAKIGDGSTDDSEINITTERKMDRIRNWRTHETAGDISSCLLTEDYKARVYPIPTSAPNNDLYLTCYVTVTTDATAIADRIYYDWRRVIRHGVLGELMGINKKPWTDLKAAAWHASEYYKGRAQAKGRALQGKAENNMVADFSGSTMF